MRISKTILITILSLTLLFYIGCDNENKTGGGGAEGGTGTEERRTIRVTGKTTQEPAIIFFANHYPEIGNITSVKVISITKKKYSDPNPPFTTDHGFEYNIVTGELKLSDASLGYLASGYNPLNKGVEYGYTLKLAFNDDESNPKEEDIIVIKDYE